MERGLTLTSFRIRQQRALLLEFFRVPQVKSKKVNNLYFVGQWVIAGGFSPAIVSGGLCAERIV